MDDITIELNLPINQVLAFFNKAIRKLSSSLRRIEEGEVAKNLKGSTLFAADTSPKDDTEAHSDTQGRIVKSSIDASASDGGPRSSEKPMADYGRGEKEKKKKKKAKKSTKEDERDTKRQKTA